MRPGTFCRFITVRAAAAGRGKSTWDDPRLLPGAAVLALVRRADAVRRADDPCEHTT